MLHRSLSRTTRCALLVLAGFVAFATAERAEAARRFPDIVVVTVDTLRYDRLSIHDYGRPTSPHLDALMGRGVRFDQARVPEPLTAPSMVSLMTSLHPHDHGATRNGLRMRPSVPSLPRVLADRGYKTAAFVGNWTLNDDLLGLGEHFETYELVTSRKRWLGLFFAEATAQDLNQAALDWVEEQRADDQRWPLFLWVHYAEPHEPYRYWDEYAERLGPLDRQDPSDRYDTEIAFVDDAIGKLLSSLGESTPSDELMVVFLSDHGESLGEHGYWGHGRNLYEETLRVPMSISWSGQLDPETVIAPASSLDLAPTILGLLGLPVSPALAGFDWTPQLLDGEPPPEGRVTRHQAHKGAVQRQTNPNARRQGLLEVGLLDAGRKEVLRTEAKDRYLFELEKGESRTLVEKKSAPSSALEAWLATVREGLEASDTLPPPTLDEEDLEKLRALGYID